MSGNKRHTRSKEEFQKYLEGKLSEKGSHKFEYEVLQSEFEQEAAEGYMDQDPDIIKDDLIRLQRRLGTSGSHILRIAAVVSFLAVASVAVWFFTINTTSGDLLTMNEEKEEVPKQQPATPEEKDDQGVMDQTVEPEQKDIDFTDQPPPVITDETQAVATTPQEEDIEVAQEIIADAPLTTAQITDSDQEDFDPSLVTDQTSEVSELVAFEEAEEVFAAQDVISEEGDLTFLDDTTSGGVASNLTDVAKKERSGEGVQPELAPAAAMARSMIAGPPDTKLEPIGGLEAFDQYIIDNKIYPDTARMQGIEGEVVIVVTIDENGVLAGTSIKKGIGSGCDQEAIRLVNAWNQGWNPTIQNGVAVRDEIEITFQFP